MFDTIDPNILIVSTASAVVGLGALRMVFARAAIAGSIRKAEPDIKILKERIQQRLTPLSPLAEKSFSHLAEVGKVAKDIRRQEIEKISALHVPKPTDVENKTEVMKATVIGLGVLTAGYAASVVQYKLTSILAQDVYHNLGKGTIHNIPVRGMIDQKISAAMQALGLTDVATHVAAEFARIHVPHMVGHIVMKGAAIPGIGTLIMTGKDEISRLIRNETTIKDALIYGGGTAVLTVVSMKSGAATGAAVGAMFGGVGAAPGALLGGFTGWVGGYFMRESIIDNKIDSDYEELRPYMKEIEKHRIPGVKHVNKIILEKFGDFTSRVEAHPQLEQGQEAQKFAAKVISTLEQDKAAFVSDVNFQREHALQGLPDKNWYDRVLFIDRPAAIAVEYHKVCDAALAAYTNNIAAFSVLMKSDFEEAGNVMKRGELSVTRTGVFMKFARTLPTELIPALKEYDEGRNRWSASLKDKWLAGSDDVKAADDERLDNLRGVVSQYQPVMAPVYQRMQANFSRMGKAPDYRFYT